MIETIDISALTKPITDSQFEQLCAQNQDTKFELTSQGKLIIMSHRAYAQIVVFDDWHC